MTEAPDDEALFARLHHLHLAQSAWVWAIGDRGDEFALSKAADFVPALTLRVFAIQNHTALESLAAPEESKLDRIIGIPWLDNLQLSVREGLTQVAIHSHYHRGQNATRFRELGAVPPGIDLARYTQAQLNRIARELNTRPRKTLGYRIPADILADTVASTG